MVYTVTCNPAVDYVVHLEQFQYGALNRSCKEEIQCGGKGINVSAVLNEMGIPNKALGFIGGFTGELLCEKLSLQGIETDFIKLESGMTRINVKMKSNAETEINANGPQISSQELNKMSEKIRKIQENDILILSGSVPGNVSDTIYAQWMSELSSCNIRTVVDASGKLLLNALPYHPFLIKPNLQELCELFGMQISSEEEILSCAKKLQEQGAENVLVSLGKEGALLLCETQQVYRVAGVQGTVQNSVGAGDSMVAGFIAGFLESGDYRQALRYGAAAGSATAFSLGLAAKEAIQKYIKICDVQPYKLLS